MNTIMAAIILGLMIFEAAKRISVAIFSLMIAYSNGLPKETQEKIEKDLKEMADQL